MNKIQHIELLKLRGISELKGSSVRNAIKNSGGNPTTEEMVKVNEASMIYYINRFKEEESAKILALGEIINLKNVVEELNHTISSQRDDIELAYITNTD